MLLQFNLLQCSLVNSETFWDKFPLLLLGGSFLEQSKRQDFSVNIKWRVVSCLGDSCLPRVALGFDYLLCYPAFFLSSVPLFRWCLSLHAIRAGRWVHFMYLSLLSMFVSGNHLCHFLEKSPSLCMTFYFFCGWRVSSQISSAISASAAAYSLITFNTLTINLPTLHPQEPPCSLTLEGLPVVPLGDGNSPLWAVLLKGIINSWAYSFILKPFYCLIALVLEQNVSCLRAPRSHPGFPLM